MRTSLFRMGAAVAVAMWIAWPGYETPAKAQSAADASAETEADAAAGAEAGAQADANQAGEATAGSDSQAGSEQADAQTDTEASGSTDAAGEASVEANGATQDTATEAGAGATADQPSITEPPARPDARTRDDEEAESAAQIEGRARADGSESSQRADTSADVDANPREGRDRDRGARSRDGRPRRDFRSGIRFGRADRGGLTINTVVRGSLFFDSGLREGDVLVSVYGRPVRSEADFYRWVVYQPGERVPVVVLRDGRQETIYIIYEEESADAPLAYDEQPAEGDQAFLGVSFDPQIRDAAIVRAVTPGSPAEHAGLQPGDMIVALNGERVASYQDAIQMIGSLRPGDRLGIEFSRRVDDRTQAILSGRPAQGPRAATLPRAETRVYQDGRGDVSAPDQDTEEIRVDDSPNRGLLNRDRTDRRSGNQPLLPRLRN